MDYEETSAEVLSCDRVKTGEIRIQTSDNRKLTIFGPSFFGGTFFQYPEVGDKLNIKIDTIDGRVVEAFA